MSGLLTTVTWELTRYKLGLMGVQEGRWDKGGTVRPGVIFSSMEKETKIN